MKFAITAVHSYWVKLIPLGGKGGSKEIKLPRGCFQLAIPAVGDVVRVEVAPVRTPDLKQATFSDVARGNVNPEED